jgi:hypothetical protein
MLRHELAHIFAARWNSQAPRVLVEGLAMYAQRTINGFTLDDYARGYCSHEEAALDWLLGPEPIECSAGRFAFYAVAGSFTAFLIRRFGWHEYRVLYQEQGLTSSNFAERFGRRFSAPFHVTVRAWLRDLRRYAVCRIPLQTSL